MKKRLFAITLIIASLLLASCSIDTAQLAGSMNNVSVPNIIGISLEDAKAELSSAGLQLGDIKYKDSSEVKDIVVLSDPLPGTSVEGGSKINLTLSSGREGSPKLTIEVPVPTIDNEVKFTVYIDGTLNDSYTTTVSPENKSIVSFTFKGRKGKKAIKIKANDQPYKSYTLDFDNGTVVEE